MICARVDGILIASPKQLSLSVALGDQATFGNFFIPDDSGLQQVVAALRQQLCADGEPLLYLWGASGSGVSHLLQSSCHAAIEVELSVQYLPLDQLVEYSPTDLFEGMEQLDLVCLDNLQAVMGKPEWEQELFYLFNRLRDNRCRLLVGADASAKELAIKLPDLQSRLGWGVTFHLPMLDDDAKVALLIYRAAERGMDVSDAAARYILNHAPRDMGALIDALDHLDRASLQAQRKLTIPFIKEALGW